MKKIKIIFLVLIMFTNITILAKANDMNTLSSKQQAIVSIAAYTANPNADKLKTAIAEGLEAQLTVNEIKEIMIQLYAYAGFPRSLNALTTFEQLLVERQKNGIVDTIGKEASPMPKNLNREEYGAETRAKLMGQSSIPAPSGYQVFAPTIDLFLKEHLFADIFYRDVLDWQSRELVTVSALAAMQNTAGQLAGHIRIALNTGLTEKQIQELINIIAIKIGKNEADIATSVLQNIIANK